MTAYSTPKRFNAQRAARRELGNPEAQEGVEFTTTKQADGTWTFHIARALLSSGDRIMQDVAEVASGAAVTVVEGTEADEPVITGPAVQARMQAEFEAAPPADAPQADVTDISMAEMRGDDLPEPEAVRAEPKRKARAPKDDAAPLADSKSAVVVAKAASPEGITNKELREITGWTKLGGFFGAVKRKGLVLRRVRENGDTRWFAEAPNTEAA